MDRAARRRSARGNGKKLAGVWLSNAPFAPTGYGTQTDQVVRRLVFDGHKMVVACNYGLEATTTTYEGIELWPKGFDVYSNDVVSSYFRDWSKQHPNHAPYLFTLYDVWTMQGPGWDSMPVVSWVPIDHLPTPPAVEAFCRRDNVTPVAMSRYGAEQLTRKGIDCHYVPHAVETSVFKHTQRVEQQTGKALSGRQLMGLPDDVFVVLIANANKSGGNVHRKAFAEQVLAFSIFAQQHDDVALFIHSEQHGAMGGLAFDPLITACGLKPHQVKFIHQYQLRLGIPQEALAAIYTAADVLLSPTYGEGFGITVVEAQSCGLPVIVSDFTAQNELAGPDSMKVSGQPYWDAAQMAWWSIPSVPEMVKCLNDAYDRGRVRSSAAATWVRENYDADLVYREHWQPLLQELADREPQTEAKTHFSVGEQSKPILTIYIPTYRRPELTVLLDSLVPQLGPDTELLISDNDGSAYWPVWEATNQCRSRVVYERMDSNIGGDANIIRGFTQGSGSWVWILGDDEVLRPDAVQTVLGALEDPTFGALDRLVLLSDRAPTSAAGYVGDLVGMAGLDPALPVAATLISANVCRRAAVDLPLAVANSSTKYGHAYAMPSSRVGVLTKPVLAKVGAQHAGQGVPDGWDGTKVKNEWLVHVGITPSEQAYSWNYMSVEAGG